VSQGGVGNAADTLEAMLFSVEVPPEAFEQVTIFAFGSIAPTSPPVLGAPTMSAAKNARLYWGATLLADFQAAATQSGVWAVTATVNKADARAQVALLATDSMNTGTDIGVRDIAICAPPKSDTAAIAIKVTGQSSAGIADLVTCNQLCVNGYGKCFL
jgi:hypothetical protein